MCASLGVNPVPLVTLLWPAKRVVSSRPSYLVIPYEMAKGVVQLSCHAVRLRVVKARTCYVFSQSLTS